MVGNGELLRRLVELLAFHHGLGQFLDEQRHAVGALDDLLEQGCRQRLAAGDVLDHRHALAPAEAVERHGGHVRMADPRRLEIGAVRDDQQHRQRMQALDGEREQLERSRVAPLRVLEHHQQRAAAGEDREPLDQRRQHLRAFALRVGRDLRALAQTEQIGQGGDVGAGAQEFLELAALDRRRVVALEAGGVRQLRHDRLQRAALMMRRGRNSACRSRPPTRPFRAAPRSAATCRCRVRPRAARRGRHRL